MLKHAIPLVLVVAVSACTTPMERRQANDVAKYGIANNNKVLPELVIPETLHAPAYSNEFKIPLLGKKIESRLIGEQLDIRPPLQVLPMAQGSRVEENTDNIQVVIESIDNDIDLKQEIFDVLNGFLDQRQIPIERSDFSAGLIETGWIQDEQEIESNLWGADKVYTLKQKYRFDVAVRPHGRTGSIGISLIEHEESYDSTTQDTILSGEDKKRYTIDMLNSAIQYMGLKRQQILKAKRVKESLGIPVELVKVDGGASYWSAAAKYKMVWERLRIVLAELGFGIVDLDKTNGLFHVELNDDSGFWSSLWADKTLPLKEGRYRVEVKPLTDDETQILLKNDDDELLTNEVVEQIYEKLSELMEEDRNK